MKNLIIMTQSRLAKGMTRASKYRKKPTMMNVPEAGGHEERPDFGEAKTLRKATKPGEYKKIAKRTCRVVKYPMESTSAAASSRSALFSSDFTGAAGALRGLLEHPRAVGHLSCRVAVTEQRPDRHHPSCSLQSLRQARDERSSAHQPQRIHRPIPTASRTRPCRSPALPHTQDPCPHRHQAA